MPSILSVEGLIKSRAMSITGKYILLKMLKLIEGYDVCMQIRNSEIKVHIWFANKSHSGQVGGLL